VCPITAQRPPLALGLNHPPTPLWDQLKFSARLCPSDFISAHHSCGQLLPQS